MAMLPNGPVCTRTGVFSVVCRRFGLRASLRMTAMAPGRVEVLRGHRPTGVREPHDDAPQALAQVGQRAGQREHHHHLAGRGDVETGLARNAVDPRPEPLDDAAQGPVVDVEDPPPRDAADVEVQRVAVVQVVVEHGREQVVGGGHGVEVTGEVQVQGLHREHLAEAGAGRAALDAERRTHRRLAQGERGAVPELVQPLGETHRRRRLPLTEGCRRDRRDDDVAGARPVREVLLGGEVDLGDVVAVRFQPVQGQAGRLRHRRDGFEGRGTRDGEVRGQRRSGHGTTVPRRRSRVPGRRARCSEPAGW